MTGSISLLIHLTMLWLNSVLHPLNGIKSRIFIAIPLSCHSVWANVVFGRFGYLVSYHCWHHVSHLSLIKRFTLKYIVSFLSITYLVRIQNDERVPLHLQQVKTAEWHRCQMFGSQVPIGCGLCPNLKGSGHWAKFVWQIKSERKVTCRNHVRSKLSKQSGSWWRKKQNKLVQQQG